MKIFTELLALGCKICPLCIIAREFPTSKFAKKVWKFSKVCPFCVAYRKTKSIEGIN